MRWAVEEKLLNGIVVLVSMRQFTRPSVPLFDFEMQHFERIRFKIGVLSNSNAIVSLLHGEFCRAFAADVEVVANSKDVEVVRSMLNVPEGNVLRVLEQSGSLAVKNRETE